MAGDWIKMRTDLGTSPKVVRMASALKADRMRVIGGLHSAWSLFDAHSEDGVLVGYTPEVLDDLIGWQGFSAALIAVEWLLLDGGNLCLPRFEVHNGQSAKRRAMDLDRKRTVRKMSASEADKKRTREEKRREESTEPNGSAAVAAPAAEDDPIWGSGLAFLLRKGIPVKPARSLLGQLRKAAGDVQCGAILADAEAQDISDPAPWLMKAAANAKARVSQAGAPVGKTMQAIQKLQGIKDGLATNGNRDGFSEALLLEPGTNPRR